MVLNEILKPVDQEVQIVQEMLDEFAKGLEVENSIKLFTDLFRAKGKALRASILFLSYKATKEISEIESPVILEMGFIVELIHNASLIHDDVIDEEVIRRGQSSANRKYGNSIAVLMGDIVFAQAIKKAISLNQLHLSDDLCDLALIMSNSEIKQAEGISNREDYLKMIEGKTARFMSLCCDWGSRYSGGNELAKKNLKAYGLCLGMVYQMRDDIHDQDHNAMKYLQQDDIDFFKDKGIKHLMALEDSIYREHLLHLIEFAARTA